MRRLSALVLGMALAGCTADTPTEQGSIPAAFAPFPAPQPGEKCVYFTEDGEKILFSDDCEPGAFGLDISFAGKATIRAAPIGGTFFSPAGITGLRTMIDPATGEITDMRFLQGTRVLSQSVLPPLAAGSKAFDLEARKITDARWIGGGAITVPKDANDVHYFVAPPIF